MLKMRVKERKTIFTANYLKAKRDRNKNKHFQINDNYLIKMLRIKIGKLEVK